MFALYKIISRHVEQIIYKEINKGKGIALRKKISIKKEFTQHKCIFKYNFFEPSTRS